MPRPRALPRHGVLAVLALAVLGPAACAVQTASVPMPAADAEPSVVVRAYLDALEAEDCVTARALYYPGSQPVAPWCGDVEVSDTVILEVQDEGGCCAPGVRYGESVYVPVEVVTRGGEPELPDGNTPWGYVLVRDSGDDPWRISGEGLG